jgi:ribosomal protein L37AE/L43A
MDRIPMSRNTTQTEENTESKTTDCPFCGDTCRETRDGTQFICDRCARHFKRGDILGDD